MLFSKKSEKIFLLRFSRASRRVGIPAFGPGVLRFGAASMRVCVSTPRPAPGSTICHAGGLKAANSPGTAILAVSTMGVCD